MPTKAVPDYDAIVAYVEKHGYMLLDMSLSWNAVHAALHHRGLGLRRVYDVRGEHIGWRAEPVRKHKP